MGCGVFLPPFPLDSDACAVPVLTPVEAASIDPTGSPRPAPHPRLSRTPASSPHPGSATRILEPGSHNEATLVEIRLSAEERDTLVQASAFGEEARDNSKAKAKL